MAKKKEEKAEPVISSIPVPPSDSALVIDLPDGQKLLVGKIETGTVIEVATWRGTGRPDSRTNRLMLGMSNEADAKAQEGQRSENNPEGALKNSKLSFLAGFVFKFQALIVKARPIVVKLVSQIKSVIKNRSFSIGKKPKALKIEREPQKSISEIGTMPETDFEAEFQKILDGVSERRASQKGKTKKSSPSKQASRAKSKATKPKNTKSSK